MFQQYCSPHGLLHRHEQHMLLPGLLIQMSGPQQMSEARHCSRCQLIIRGAKHVWEFAAVDLWMCVGADEEEELLSRLVAAAAARDVEPQHLGEETAVSPTHSQCSAAAAAIRRPEADSRLYTEHTLAAWHIDSAVQDSRSPSVSPARTPTAAAAAAGSKQQQQQQQHFHHRHQQQQPAAGKPPLPTTGGQQLQQELQQMLQQPRHKRTASNGSACSAFSAVSVQSQSNAEKAFGRVGSSGDVSCGVGGSDVTSSVKGDDEPESLGRVYLEVFSCKYGYW